MSKKAKLDAAQVKLPLWVWREELKDLANLYASVCDPNEVKSFGALMKAFASHMRYSVEHGKYRALQVPKGKKLLK